jgi:hypothetical protein
MMNLKINMDNVTDYLCPFYGVGCDCSLMTLADYLEHLRNHTDAILMFQDLLGLFWGPLIMSCCRHRDWPKIGTILGARRQEIQSLLEPIPDPEEAKEYWLQGTISQDAPMSEHLWYEHGSSTGGTDISETEQTENEPRFQCPPELRRRREPLPPIRHDVERPADFAPESFHQDTTGEEAAEEAAEPGNREPLGILEQRAGALLTALTEDSVDRAAELLESALQDCAETTEAIGPPIEFRLEDPIILLVAQGKCHEIPRTERKCPGCDYYCRTEGILLSHLRSAHQFPEPGCQDYMRMIFEFLYPGRFSVKVRKIVDRTIEDRPWNVERCPFPGCNYFQNDRGALWTHMGTMHKEMVGDIKKLGWFWGGLRSKLRKNPDITIAEAIGEGNVFKCGTCANRLEKVNIRTYHTHAVLQGFYTATAPADTVASFRDGAFPSGRTPR